jgi:acyl-ACP thioesterase
VPDPQPFTEIIPPPEHGRVFREQRRAALGDCAPSGRMRLDAIARWLQDVAYDDVDDAGVAEQAVWVVRRARLRIVRFPRFGERAELGTFCSGVGRAWAERRTSVTRVGEAVSDIESVSLWVHLDPATWQPAPFTEEEIAVYGETAGDRRITARLRHPAPGEVRRRIAWTFRGSESDIAQHINNAAYWTVLEEELLAGPEPSSLDVEMEYRTPAQPGETTVLASGERRWIVGGEGETHASIVIGAGPVT